MSELNIGIIGFGFIAKVHARNIANMPKINIKSIFSLPDVKNQIPKGIAFYDDYKKMIADQELDAILICTPTHTHKEITCHCAEQGIKNIFLEKPMALSIEDCNAILDSVKENNAQILIGHVLRFWPTYGSIQQYITNPSSDFGEIISFEGKRLQTFPWSPWFADQQKSGGVILDLSIHDIDYAMWIFNKMTSVSCKAKILNKHGMDVYGESLTTLNFINDKIAECEASWAKPSDFQFYTYAKLVGENNTLEFDGGKIFNNENLNISNVFKSEDGYVNQIEHFFDVIVGGTPRFLVSGLEGKSAVKACLAAINSAKSNGKEIFIDELE